MKLVDLWKAKSSPTLSFEFFPPKTPKAVEDLERALQALLSLHPDFVSVTFGAGGSTREGSLQLAAKLKQTNGPEVVGYFAGCGLGPDEIQGVLEAYAALGLHSILVVRGDLPHLEGFTPHPASFAHASDLLAFVRPRFDFCMGVAGHPEGHVEAPSREQDLDYLKRKADLGAEFVITNFFYDNRYFFDFRERCRTRGIDLPILPGIMPIFSFKMMERLASACGASIPDDVRKKAATLDETDKPGLQAYGVELALRQCEGLLEGKVPGIHFYTMNRSAAALGIVQGLRGSGRISPL